MSLLPLPMGRIYIHRLGACMSQLARNLATVALVASLIQRHTPALSLSLAHPSGPFTSQAR